MAASSGRRFAAGGGEAHVDFVVDHAGEGHVHGAQTCDSVWQCPVCGPRVWQAQNEVVHREIARLLPTHFVMMVLGTVPHHRRQPLAEVQGHLGDVLAKTLAAIRRRTKRDHDGVPSYIRALEHTHGDHGWHPHIHALLLVPKAWYPDDIDGGAVAAEWRQLWVQTWIRQAETVGLKVNAAAIGADLAASAEAAVEYVTKAELRSAVAELTLGQDTKTGGASSRTPFQILDDITRRDAEGRRLDPENMRDVRLWQEYAAATHKVRRLTGSRDLRLGLDSQTDDDDAERQEDPPPVQVVAHLAGPGLGYVTARGYLPGLLEALERAAPERRYTALVEAGEAVGLRRELWRPGPAAHPADRPAVPLDYPTCDWAAAVDHAESLAYSYDREGDADWLWRQVQAAVFCQAGRRGIEREHAHEWAAAEVARCAAADPPPWGGTPPPA